MLSIAILIAVSIAIAALSYVWQRRLDTSGQVAAAGTIPTHLQRQDFVGADVAWLIVEFSSATCLACADVWARVEGFESPTVAIANVSYQTDEALHRTYGIDSVPTTVVVDAEGAVRAGYLGPLSPTAVDEIVAVISSAGDPAQ